jgi:hypothetical protein
VLFVVVGVVLRNARKNKRSDRTKAVMSSAKTLDLRDGKKDSTGFYLNEFAIPFRKLIEAGYTPVVVNPNGGRPLMERAGRAIAAQAGKRAALDDSLAIRPKSNAQNILNISIFKNLDGFTCLSPAQTLAVSCSICSIDSPMFNCVGQVLIKVSY